jgi:hypothetical protein
MNECSGCDCINQVRSLYSVLGDIHMSVCEINGKVWRRHTKATVYITSVNTATSYFPRWFLKKHGRVDLQMVTGSLAGKVKVKVNFTLE